jgi:hypothetical protein
VFRRHFTRLEFFEQEGLVRLSILNRWTILAPFEREISSREVEFSLGIRPRVAVEAGGNENGPNTIAKE